MSETNSSADKKLEMMVSENYGKLTSNMCTSFHSLFIKRVEVRQFYFCQLVIWLYSIGIMIGHNVDEGTCMSTVRFPCRQLLKRGVIKHLLIVVQQVCIASVCPIPYCSLHAEFLAIEKLCNFCFFE